MSELIDSNGIVANAWWGIANNSEAGEVTIGKNRDRLLGGLSLHGERVLVYIRETSSGSQAIVGNIDQRTANLVSSPDISSLDEVTLIQTGTPDLVEDFEMSFRPSSFAHLCERLRAA